MSIQPTLSQVISAVAIGLGVTTTEVKYGRRGSLLAEPAQIAAYLASTLTTSHVEEIRAELGGCMATAVAMAHGQVAMRWREDRSFREFIKDLSIAVLAEAKALDTLRIKPPRDLDAVALAQAVQSGRLRPTDLSTLEIFALAAGLVALARPGAPQLQEASHEH